MNAGRGRRRTSEDQTARMLVENVNNLDIDEDDYDDDGHFDLDSHVESVDLLPLENALAHHTEKYDALRESHLVVRRGQPFSILVRFTGKFSAKNHSVRIVFKTGPTPRPGKGSHVQCILSSKSSQQDWTAVIASRQGQNALKVSIFPPANCIVASWRLVLESIVERSGRPKAYKYIHPKPVHILFNPWCKDDAVYLDDPNLLNEYILNESGAIFHGNYKQIGAKPWFFGQFEDGILEASLHCIQKGFNSNFCQAMGDPVRTSRIISKIVNSSDDGGVLLGNWSEDYTGGKSPMAWSGSVAILREYMKTNLPVKFGQCFVFSGIVTTICRAVGLPCRSVTNFASAHDTDGSVTIDFYWDLDQKEVLSGIGDSIWNFHCWNDVWMRRDDLPVGYSGWQVVDSTPQERSDGMFQCGPTSLRAIKGGKCDMLYDCPFVFAEVNADKVNWTRDTDKQWIVLSMNLSAIGRNISTKIPDGKPLKPELTYTDSIRQDITDDYKHPEESERERLAVISASRSAASKKPVYNKGIQDVKFGGFLHRDNIIVGRQFDVKITFQNSSQSRRTLQGKFICETVTYTGEKLGVVKKQEFSTPLAPITDGEMSMDVHYADYMNKLTEHAAMKVIVVAKVMETGQVHVWQDDFRLRRPDLSVEITSPSSRTSQPFECRISFLNPLNQNLTRCTLMVEGPGLDAEKEFIIADVGAGETWVALLTLTPKKPGRRQVAVTFNCDQLKDLNGVTEINITN
ncbi:protein-glutamine gamma-glutamyltransferase K-like [Mizuhopecten yessoensis]|uniref:protein-glutamine gamma-glutamyltransferase K-like n=1 Tax=Mizuhopecten yessoensis TaxID=6573 RepID=UPI000B45A3C6|nr:protein-glutamine gamma-glutamyltransferase K-like [Mizuhopecten yessoensis]